MLKGFVSGEEKDIVRIPMKVGNEYKEGWEVRDNQDRLIWGREDELQTATGTLLFKGYTLPVKVKSLLGNAVQNGTPAPDNITIPEMCGKLIGTDWTIPLINAGQTIPVYLGEVPTVRRVKKLVLTGTEAWNYSSSSQAHWIANVPNDYNNMTYGIITTLCTHYRCIENNTGLSGMINGDLRLYAHSTSPSTHELYIKDDAHTTTADFKAYLASQYAAGHPVTVWYVLANEQTGIVNEPLCKISTYADELTTIQVHGLSAPLYGIGDYKDTLNLSTGVITRKVKKLVLDGTESWTASGEAANVYYVSIPGDEYKGSTATTICTHFKSVRNATNYLHLNNYEMCLYSGSSTAIHTAGFKYPNSSLSDFKSYLAAQYANGTPVTIWYVLNTPTTETVTVPTGMTGEIEGYLTQVSTPTPTNRSVPKWNGVEETGGTYAVTVYTPPEIPTTTGQNTLTVETDLAPSKLTVKGHIKELT